MNKILDKVTSKNIYIIMQTIFYLCLLPIIVLAFYSYPCADDFSASDTVHLAWVNTSSVLAVIEAAWDNVVYNYLEWSGVFMSVFWTSLQFGIFGEEYYGVVTLLTIIVMLVGGLYLGHVIFDKYLKADKYTSRCIIYLYLFVSIQCMPDGNEGLYWHAGVVNYTWAFAFLLMLLGVVLSIYIELNFKKKVLKTILACFLAVCVGGGNFITALQGSIWLLFLVIIICGLNLYAKKEKTGKFIKRNFCIILPTVVNVVAFVASVLAPGNKVRSASSTGLGAIKSVLVSFYYVLNDSFEKWVTWSIIMVLAIAVPFMWQIVKKMDYSFKYPGIVALFGFCFVAAAYTPSLYAQGSIEAGRLNNTVFFIWIFFVYIITFYILGWLNEVFEFNAEKKDIKLTRIIKKYILGMVFFGLIFSGLTVIIDEEAYIGAHAGYSIINGQAQIYREENERRLELLYSDEKKVIFPSFSNPPELLLFQDITNDENEWLNQAMAEYYGKESVRRE